MIAAAHRAAQPRTSRALVRDASASFAAAGLGEARHEAEWLLSHVTGATPVALYLEDAPVSDAAAEAFWALMQARCQGAPLQYLTGWTEFYGRRFTVGPGVFIPRPETESVVDAALGRLRALARARQRPLRVLELGTGSGAIAATLACELPACTVVAVELSWVAVHTARQNALELGVGSRVHCLRGRWADAVRGTFDAVISNPPYVASDQLDQLPRDVQQEPRLSLDGGRNGLDPYDELLSIASATLVSGGIVALECAEAHVGALVELAAARRALCDIEAIHDLAGRPRGILCQASGAHG